MFVSIITKNAVKCHQTSAKFGRRLIPACAKVNQKIFKNQLGNLARESQSCNGNRHSRKPVTAIHNAGQPTAATHPHLFADGELFPGLKLDEFHRRRRTFMNLIFEDVKATYGGKAYVVAIVPSATKLCMTEDIPYVFHQNNDYLYLSGCLSPDTLLILSGNSEENLCSTLFVRKRDAHSDTWEGPRIEPDAACQLFGVNEAFYVQDLTQFLVDKVNKHPNHLIYYNLNKRIISEPSIHQAVVNHITKYNLVMGKSCKCFLDQIRLVKSPAEQDLMRQACEISSAAIRKTMEITQPGMTEHQLFATVDYECRMRGAEILAYPPVVASGRNANFIHYIYNNQKMKDGDLVLMDAGGEYHGYCGDITRTWPVNGKFTQYQRVLYELVLEVEKNLVAACESKSSLNVLYEKMIFLLGDRLRKENILKKTSSEINLKQVVRELCPHHVSHYLGMDIHDVASIDKNISLQPGMIVTIEPGLYTKEHPAVHPEFWNLGIRVEDDILITDTGYENLTVTCPKEIDEIERIMQK